MSAKAPAVEAPIEAEVLAAIRLAWRELHPKVADVVITKTDDGAWLVHERGASYVEKCQRSAHTFHFQPVGADHETPTGPGVVVAIPRAPEPAPVVAAFDPAAARARVLKTLDTVRTAAERTRRELRQVEATDEAERQRLRAAVPLAPVTMDGRPLDTTAPTKVLARSALRAVTEAQSFGREVAAAAALSVEIRTALREAAAQSVTEAARPLDDLPDLGALGEILGERRAQREYDLGECRVALDKLDRVLDELRPIVPRFHEVARRHAVVAADVLVEAVVGLATLKLAQIRAEAVAVRSPHEALRIASEALHLIDPALAVPGITWPSDPLAPPSVG